MTIKYVNEVHHKKEKKMCVFSHAHAHRHREKHTEQRKISKPIKYCPSHGKATSTLTTGLFLQCSHSCAKIKREHKNLRDAVMSGMFPNWRN